MKILITGSVGFIGFSMADSLLKAGHTILGYDSVNKYYDVKLKHARNRILKKYKKYYFVKGALENYKKINKTINNFKPQIILHFAAQAGVRYSLMAPKKYLSSNINGTFNVIEAARNARVKHLLIASSSSVYGLSKKKKFKEIDKVDDQISIYAATKKSTESIAHAYSSLWKVPITMLRFFTVYGPWGRPDMAYFKFTESIINHKKIDVYNNGQMFRDFTYIDDVTKSITLLLNKIPNNKIRNKFKNDSISNVAPFRIINIGNQKKILLNDFIISIEKSLNQNAKKKFLPMQKGDVKETLSDSNLLYAITKFKPTINYKEGIYKFVKWYKNYYIK